MDEKRLALCVVKAVTDFLTEMDSAKTSPNIVTMNREQYEAVRNQFPYLIDGTHYIDGSNRLKILINSEENTIVGVGLSFYTEDVIEYKSIVST